MRLPKYRPLCGFAMWLATPVVALLLGFSREQAAWASLAGLLIAVCWSGHANE
jgi:hypothetical protein